jgi:HK97 family phage prohead protease
MKNQELRTLNVAIRAAAKEDAFELHGTALSYNVLSRDLGGFRERFLPGAFTRALADSKTDVRMLFNHSVNHVLGRQSNGTLTLMDTPNGLNFCCKLDPNQQAHRDLHSSIKRGDINSCSFAFKPDADGEAWDDAKDERGAWFTRRTVKQASIYDCSVVTHAAYDAPGATTVVARSSAVIVPTRNHQVSLEEQYRRLTGHEYVSTEQLRMRLATADLQIKAAAARELAADKQLRERLEAAGRQIRVDALIEEMFED